MITVYTLWQTISKDCVYGQSGISLSAADYICNKLDLLLVLEFCDTPNRTVGRGNIVQHSNLSMCEALEHAYKNDHNSDKEWEISAAEIEAEIFVISMLAAGLKVTTKTPPIFDPYRHDHYSLAEFAGYDEIKQQDLNEFFNMYSLPLPHALFKDSPLNTGLLFKQRCASHDNWSIKLSIADLMRFCDTQLRQKQQHDVITPDDKFVFQRHGEYFNIVFNGNSVHLKSSKGLEIFQYLLKKPTINVSLNELHIAVYGDGVLSGYTENSAVIIVERLSIGLNADEKAYKRKRGRVMAACDRALRVLKKQLPSLEQHLRGATSFRGGFRYYPKDILPWKF